MITVIGDSHVSGFMNDNCLLTVNEFNNNDQFNVLHLGPKTVYGFHKIIDNVMEQLLSNYEFLNSEKLLLSIGEIDIRSHMFNKESNRLLNLNFCKTLSNIINTLESLGKPVILYGYVAPLNDSTMFSKDICNVHGTFTERNLARFDIMNLLRIFNIKYFDIYGFTNNSDGFLDPAKTFDGLHLNKETMDIIKKEVVK